jgi:hypothetical protein
VTGDVLDRAGRSGLSLTILKGCDVSAVSHPTLDSLMAAELVESTPPTIPDRMLLIFEDMRYSVTENDTHTDTCTVGPRSQGAKDPTRSTALSTSQEQVVCEEEEEEEGSMDSFLKSNGTSIASYRRLNSCDTRNQDVSAVEDTDSKVSHRHEERDIQGEDMDMVAEAPKSIILDDFATAQKSTPQLENERKMEKVIEVEVQNVVREERLQDKGEEDQEEENEQEEELKWIKQMKICGKQIAKFKTENNSGNKVILGDGDVLGDVDGASDRVSSHESCRIEVGSKVEGDYRGKGRWYAGTVTRDCGDGTFEILYKDGESETRVDLSTVSSLPCVFLP